MTDQPQITDFPRIWLEPAPPAGLNDERCWCQDDVWTGESDYDGAVPTEYVRADLVAVKDGEIARLRAVIRVNALRWNPALTHEEIERVIEGN